MPVRPLRWLLVLSLPLPSMAQDVSPRAGYPLAPVPFDAVTLNDSFWRPRLELQRRVLVPHAFERTKASVAYLQAAADKNAGHPPDPLPPPHRYMNSDLYKVLEGAAYLLAVERDPELEARIDAIAKVIAAAQRDDGYLYCAHILGNGSAAHMMGDGPYQYVVHSHELYNVGHLYEAAVAFHRATGKRTLLDVAEKSARHVRRVFFEGDPAYFGGVPVRQAPGHQEIELALVKLANETGDATYLDTARRFLEVRGVTYVPDGQGVMAPHYAQQHAPVAEQREAVGHAVRAAYMYAAMADVDAMRGTQEFTAALDAIWHDIVDTRMHVTGGLGAVHGIEGFGPQYELPNLDAYDETCAAVGNVLFNFRMFLLHRDARYLDVAEVALFNNVLAGVALTGDRFFYVNPLEADGVTGFNHGSPERAAWFGTACCPTNLARLLPQIAGMVYAHEADRLYVNLFVGSETSVSIGGSRVGVAQRTEYPFDGRVELKFEPSAPVSFELRLRTPTWTGDRFVPGALYQYAAGAATPCTIAVNGEPIDYTIEQGFAVIRRTWRANDRVELAMAMPVRASTCDPRVEADRDRVVLTRGPLVLCAENADNPDGVQRVFFAGVPPLEPSTLDVRRTEIAAGHATTFVTVPAQLAPVGGDPHDHPLVLVPYYAWNNRGPGAMVTWIPTRADRLPDPRAGIANPAIASVRASHTWSGDRVLALVDGKLPRSSSDTTLPRWTSWPQRGRAQQVELRFDRPRIVHEVRAYWYDDGGGVQVPVRWAVEVERDGHWLALQLAEGASYGVSRDAFDAVRAAPGQRATAVRLVLQPRDDAAVGILETEVGFGDD